MSDPVFDPPVTNPFGLTGGAYDARPTLVDIDGDGDLDAFVCKISNGDGYASFYRNTGTASNPIFASPVTDPFGLTDMDNQGLAFADIDSDGDLDAFMVVSRNQYPGILFYRNTGSVSNPAFASPDTNPFGLTDVDEFSRPILVDIDGDGDLDAFVGSTYLNAFVGDDLTTYQFTCTLPKNLI